MTIQEKKNISNLTKYPEWASFEAVLKEFIARQTDISTIRDSDISIEAQVLGRQWIVKELETLLSGIGIITPGKTTDKTYE